MRRLAAFDMDGTLLLPDQRLGDKTLHSLRALQAHPVELTFATGRHFLEMQPLMRKYDLSAYLISGNGTRVHDPLGEVLYACDLPAAIARAVIDGNWQTRASLHVFNDNGWFTQHDDPAILQAHQLSDFHYQLIDLRDLPEDQITKACFIADHQELLKLEILLRECLGQRAHVCFSAWDCLEVLPLDCNKGAALRRLTTRLGIAMADCMAFGDAMNDAEMLEGVGQGFIMRNAMGQLKNQLPHLPVIGDCMTQGVSHYLDHWLTTPHLDYSPE